jgi:hypothetical protein
MRNRSREVSSMGDVVFVAVTLVAFVALVLLVRGVDRL